MRSILLFSASYAKEEVMEDRKKIYQDNLKWKRLSLHLRTIRKSRGMSEQDAADACGYKSGTMITAIENGTRRIDQEKIKEIANALGVSISQLLGFRKIDTTEKGWPKLTESEKTALFLFAPILEVLGDADTEYLLDTGLLLCKASGKEPAWNEPEFMKAKKERREDAEENTLF